MRVQFDATFDDFVDSTVEAAERAIIRKKSKWPYAIATGLFAGVTLYAIIPDSVPVKLTFGIIGLLGGFIAYHLLYIPLTKRIVGRNVRKYLRQTLPSSGPFPVVVSLVPDGISFSQIGNEIKFGWRNIEQIEDSSDGIKFIGRNGEFGVVRKRAFQSTEMEMSFLREAQSYHANSEKEIARGSRQSGDS